MIKDNKGFTIVELMVVVGISAFIWVAVYGILATARSSWLIEDALLILQQEARIGLDNMIRELQQASSVNVIDNSTVRFNIPIDADGDGFIDLIAGTSTIIYGADDFGDFDGDGILYERDWNIEYQRDTVNNQIIRRIVTPDGTVVNQRVVARNICPSDKHNYFCAYSFQTKTCEAGKTTLDAVNIKLTTEIDEIRGVKISSPLRVSLMASVNLRN